jgi:hypothetical protein
VKNVPTDVASKLCHPSRRIPVAISGLLQHESKMSVLHFRYSSCTHEKFYVLSFRYGISLWYDIVCFVFLSSLLIHCFLISLTLISNCNGYYF